MTMTRRGVLEGLGALALGAGLRGAAGAAAATPSAHELAGTAPLTRDGDLAAQMNQGIHEFLLAKTAASIEARSGLWHGDFSSREAYERSVGPNRTRFAKVIGLMDTRIPDVAPNIELTLGESKSVASGDGYEVYSVHLPVLDGVDTEGLLLKPAGAPVAQVVAIPDADWSPEMLVGLTSEIAAPGHFARRLAENGCLVFVPTLIDRKDTWSGNPTLGIMTNLTHREYIYRMSYEVGRHILGYEVQKVLAVVDWFRKTSPSCPIGVMGYGEGGLLALLSGAADTRIDAVCVSGYFRAGRNPAEEPLYRNVWALLHEFGDAELAGLIAPRHLVVEASKGPEISGPPAAGANQRATAASGRLVSPTLPRARSETERARSSFEKLGVTDHLSFAVSDEGKGLPGSDEALRAFLRAFDMNRIIKPSGSQPQDNRTAFDPAGRLHRQFKQLVDFSQKVVVIESEVERTRFWADADDASLERWGVSAAFYRRYLWEEVFGKLPPPTEKLSAQSRRVFDEPLWTGYEVVIPLWPLVFAYGFVLVPKSIKPGEQRPVVVCQHGLEGRPQDLIKPGNADAQNLYKAFAAQLADQGFVVYCPQDLYTGEDTFRQLQRLANPLKLSIYSFILSQHERVLDWLETQPYVDAKRIGFYGMSYGGKTALHVPPLLGRYALSIVSGDFNEWIWKTCRDDEPFTYLFAGEYEIYEFDLGNTFNHSDLANLLIPRPFMVERGHRDGSSFDSWVAFEYAKVRRRYDVLGLQDRTCIEYFDGPHTIHGVGTFAFLHKFLAWPPPVAQSEPLLEGRNAICA